MCELFLGNLDFFLARYNRTGGEEFLKQEGTPEKDEAIGAMIHTNCDIYMQFIV
jgi:hypothetical protein